MTETFTPSGQKALKRLTMTIRVSESFGDLKKQAQEGQNKTEVHQINEIMLSEQGGFEELRE